MLIGMDIMTLEGIDLLASKQVAWINSCKVEAPIETYAKGTDVHRPVHAKYGVTIPPHSMATIQINHIDLPDRDFFFDPTDTKISLYASIVDKNFGYLLAKKRHRFGYQNPSKHTAGRYQRVRVRRCCSSIHGPGRHG